MQLKIKLRIPIKNPSLANVPTTRITKYRSPRPKAPAAKKLVIFGQNPSYQFPKRLTALSKRVHQLSFEDDDSSISQSV